MYLEHIQEPGEALLCAYYVYGNQGRSVTLSCFYDLFILSCSVLPFAARGEVLERMLCMTVWL